jgi:hypothetical protein
MIETVTIRFTPADVPVLPELERLPEPEDRHETPEPAGWRPLGVEW